MSEASDDVQKMIQEASEEQLVLLTLLAIKEIAKRKGLMVLKEPCTPDIARERRTTK